MNEAIVVTNVRWFQLRALIGALKLEQEGLRHSRGSALAIAKRLTGLRTNDRAKQIERLDQLSKEALS